MFVIGLSRGSAECGQYTMPHFATFGREQLLQQYQGYFAQKVVSPVPTQLPSATYGSVSFVQDHACTCQNH